MIFIILSSCKVNLRVRYQFYINEFKLHPCSCLDQRNTLITGMSTINMKKRKHFLYEIISQILEISQTFILLYFYTHKLFSFSSKQLAWKKHLFLQMSIDLWWSITASSLWIHLLSTLIYHSTGVFRKYSLNRRNLTWHFSVDKKHFLNGAFKTIMSQ